MKHFLYLFLIVSVLAWIPAKAQTSTLDSTSILFPNPAHNDFFITSQGQIIYAFIVATSGIKKVEFQQYDIISYQNQFGSGCGPAGSSANIASNFICTLHRGYLENGLYYLIMFDAMGKVYFKRLVLN